MALQGIGMQKKKKKKMKLEADPVKANKPTW